MEKYVLEVGWRGFEPEEDIQIRVFRLNTLDAVKARVDEMEQDRNSHIAWYRCYELVPIAV